MDLNNFPAFTESFHKEIQKLDQRTKDLSPYRLIVKKIDESHFETTLNLETEKEFDELFSSFIQKFGTHFNKEVSFGGKLTFKSKTEKIKKNGVSNEEFNKCFKKAQREKIKELVPTTSASNKDTCQNKDLENRLEESLEESNLAVQSIGAHVTNAQDIDSIAKWSKDQFESPDIINTISLYPILTIFQNKIMNLKRISDKFGNPINIADIYSWMMPRYAILLNRCKTLPNHRVDDTGSRCVPCPDDESEPSQDGLSCVCPEVIIRGQLMIPAKCSKCPGGHVPVGDECVKCPVGQYANNHWDIDGYRRPYRHKKCQNCWGGSVPSEYGDKCQICPDLEVPDKSGAICQRCPVDKVPSFKIIKDVLHGYKNIKYCRRCDSGQVPSDHHGKWVRWVTLGELGVFQNFPEENKVFKKIQKIIDLIRTGFRSVTYFLI